MLVEKLAILLKLLSKLDVVRKGEEVESGRTREENGKSLVAEFRRLARTNILFSSSVCGKERVNIIIATSDRQTKVSTKTQLQYC